MDQHTPEHFFSSSELELALREQSFGIESYSISPDDRLLACVILLEGNTITISLTTRGYQAVDSDVSSSPTVFESIEPLLESVSPAYRAERQTALISRLERLASDANR